MGTIKLNNNQELSIISDGIQASGDWLDIRLVPGDKSLVEYDEIFGNIENTEKITVMDYLGNPFKIHSGYTKLRSIEKMYDVVVAYEEDEEGNKVPVQGAAIKVSLLRPDETELRIKALEETVDTLVMESLGL